MGDILNITFFVGLFAATLRLATPLIFGTIGELFIEKSGVLNLGIEGNMLLGALVGFVTVRVTGNLWLGVLAAGLAGSLMNIILAFFAVTLGVSQHVTGLGITFLSTGLAMFSYRHVIGSPSIPPTIEPFDVVHVPFLAKIPYIGEIFFQQYALVYIAIGIAGLSAFVLYKTPWGLRIRTVGENPAAADTVGVNVSRVRYRTLVWGGFLIGVGGAFLSLAQFNMFIFGLVSGRGWICLALVIFGGYRAGRCLIGALLFGMIDALQLRLQGLGFDIPYQFFLLLPYLITLIALILVARKAIYPAAFLEPYRREE